MTPYRAKLQKPVTLVWSSKWSILDRISNFGIHPMQSNSTVAFNFKTKPMRSSHTKIAKFYFVRSIVKHFLPNVSILGHFEAQQSFVLSNPFGQTNLFQCPNTKLRLWRWQHIFPYCYRCRFSYSREHTDLLKVNLHLDFLLLQGGRYTRCLMGKLPISFQWYFFPQSWAF